MSVPPIIPMCVVVSLCLSVWALKESAGECTVLPGVLLKSC